MQLPESQTPLYNHTLPDIEQWLKDLGAVQDPDNLPLWNFEQRDINSRWKAKIILDIEEITVYYLAAAADGTDIRRSYKYSLSRQDIEDAIFSGP